MRKLSRIKPITVKSKSKKIPKKFLTVTMRGCDGCKEAKKNGACKKSQCVDVSSKLGKKLDKELKIEYTPFCVVVNKDGSKSECTRRQEKKILEK